MKKKKENAENNLLVGSEKITFPDPTDLALGLLWIQSKNGSFVNAATDPESFDQAISEHVTLFDRVNWPEVHRLKALIEADGDVPVYRIPVENLPLELQKAYNAIKKPQEVTPEELTEEELTSQ